jgi:hypothetical protein
MRPIGGRRGLLPQSTKVGSRDLAAAEAMNMMPEEIRPALRAAFRRARLAGLSVEDVDAGMGSTPGGEEPRA